MTLAALAVVCLAGVFLMALALSTWLAPARARQFLLGFATTAGRHAFELAMRVVVGAALVLAAPQVAWQGPFRVFGWVLIVSSLVLAVVPWRMHRRFAQHAVPEALKFLPAIGLAAMVAGAGLIVSVVHGSMG